MHYSDSLIPRLLPAAHTSTVRGLPAQMLVLKIDGERSVGELRMLLRHIGSFDFALEKLIAQSLVELTQPPMVPEPEPVEHEDEQAYASAAELGEMLRSLTEAFSPRPDEDEASFKARISADPDQPFYQGAREQLLKALHSEPDVQVATRLATALRENELLGLFRYWLEIAIIESTAAEAMTLISFQRQLDAALREAQKQSEAHATSETGRLLAD